MLRKLLNWEIKATSRLFIPLYITLLLFAFINRILNPFKLIESSNNFSLQTLISFISIAAYFALIVGVVVMTLVIMIQRFYKSLLGDEGYLMFTLPTTTWQHIVSKLLIASLWTIVSMLTTITSIILISKTENVGEQLVYMFNGLKKVFGTTGLYMLPVNMFLMIATGILMIYAAITLGHMFSRYKLIASFAMYGIVYMFTQILIIISILAFRNNILNSFMTLSGPTHVEARMILVFYGIFTALLATTYFTITNILLSRRLNLE